MSAYIEVRCEGDSRAIIEAGSIAGIITGPGGRMDHTADPQKPISIILRGGETIAVYGETPAEIIVRSVQVRKEVRDNGFDIKCDLIDARRSPRLAYALAIVTGVAPLPPDFEIAHVDEPATA